MKTWTRRRFIGAAAAAPLGLPFLSQFARAEEGPQRRVIFLMSPNDNMGREAWGMAPDGEEAPLPEVLPSFLEPLSAFRSKMTVIGDLEKRAAHNSHCPQTLLTGTDSTDGTNKGAASSISIDHFLANELDVDAATFGVRCVPNGPSARWSWLGENQPVDPIMDPAIAFDQYFGDFDVDPAQLEAQRARKRSLLDRVAKDLTTFRAQVSSQQRPQLDAHLQWIRDLEADIDATITAACDPGSPTFGKDAIDNASVPTSLHGLVDQLVSVMGCGLTRVGTLQFGRSGGGEIRPVWPEFGIDIDKDLHFGLAHRAYENPTAQNVADRLAQETWVTSHMVQRLVSKLDETPDGDGRTLLDNTMVVWLHEMGDKHAARDHLAVVFGGSDWIQTGSFRSFHGRSINDLLTAVAGKVGVDIAQWGAPEYNDAPIPL